ncbi:hypothetical protein [Halomarina litorea]|uniref:hypothetical protein n=1 Tax=Halomarina litorea TaxID=2961595 RepID=UPI0020C2505F|nr:hypothetical protein [Halomarina sp. BCD28]
MNRTLLAVSLAALVVLAGCSAIQINRPQANDTAEASPIATVGAAPSGGETTNGATESTDGGDETDDRDSTDGEPTDGGEGPETATATPTPTPEPERPADSVVFRNDGSDDVLVDLTLADGPATAYKVYHANGSVDVVELGDEPVGSLVAPTVTDLVPIEPVRGEATYEVDAGETPTADLPGGESWTTLVVEVTTAEDDEEDRRVVAATRLACDGNDTPGRVRVNVTDGGVTAEGDCLD